MPDNSHAAILFGQILHDPTRQLVCPWQTDDVGVIDADDDHSPGSGSVSRVGGREQNQTEALNRPAAIPHNV